MTGKKVTEFQRIANEKGWTLLEVGERWELSERQMSRVANAAKQRDLDAVNGLPKKSPSKGKIMANNLKVLDLEFTSQAEAKAYFYKIRDDFWTTKAVISESTVFEQLRELYEQYCKCTNWAMPGKPVSFRVKNIGRGQGASGGTTQGFAVTFDNGEETEFSADKAIKAIASKK